MSTATFSLLYTWPIGMYICVKILTILIRSVNTHRQWRQAIFKSKHGHPVPDFPEQTPPELFIDTWTKCANTAREKAFAEIEIGYVGCKLKFKFNRGAQANVIPAEIFHKMFANVVLGSPESNISGYGKKWNSFKLKGVENSHIRL